MSPVKDKHRLALGDVLVQVGAGGLLPDTLRRAPEDVLVLAATGGVELSLVEGRGGVFSGVPLDRIGVAFGDEIILGPLTVVGLCARVQNIPVAVQRGNETLILHALICILKMSWSIPMLTENVKPLNVLPKNFRVPVWRPSRPRENVLPHLKSWNRFCKRPIAPPEGGRRLRLKLPGIPLKITRKNNLIRPKENLRILIRQGVLIRKLAKRPAVEPTA